MSTYSFELDFKDGKDGSIPYSALAQIRIKSSTCDAAGHIFITSQCVTPAEFDEQIERFKRELDDIRQQARARFVILITHFLATPRWNRGSSSRCCDGYNGRTMETAITSLLSVIVGLFIGSYLPGYMKKKGENLATKEDIADLISQTRLLAQATREIESRIEDQVWNKQRQWELKRDAVFAAVEAMSRAEDRMVAVASAYDLAKKQGVESWQPYMSKATESWGDQMNDSDEKRFGAELVCSPTLVNAMRETAILMRHLE